GIGCWIWTPAPAVWGVAVLTRCTEMRCHSVGPPPATGTDQVDGSCWYQVTATSSHCLPPLGASRITAGWLASGVTMAELETSKISHGLETATRWRSGSAWAWARASGEKAM